MQILPSRSLICLFYPLFKIEGNFHCFGNVTIESRLNDQHFAGGKKFELLQILKRVESCLTSYVNNERLPTTLQVNFKTHERILAFRTFFNLFYRDKLSYLSAKFLFSLRNCIISLIFHRSFRQPAFIENIAKLIRLEKLNYLPINFGSRIYVPQPGNSIRPIWE